THLMLQKYSNFRPEPATTRRASQWQQYFWSGRTTAKGLTRQRVVCRRPARLLMVSARLGTRSHARLIKRTTKKGRRRHEESAYFRIGLPLVPAAKVAARLPPPRPD